MRHEAAINMYLLRFICVTIIQAIRQVWLLPHTVANAAKQRRAQAVRNELEAERLDRIRNPSKYLGK
jgi:HD-like signal output (HDOD) protein